MERGRRKECKVRVGGDFSFKRGGLSFMTVTYYENVRYV